MTYKEALLEAQRIVSGSSEEKRDEIAEILYQLSENVYRPKWTEALILDACENKVHEKAVLSVGDFGKADMPTHAAVKRVFGMTAAELRDRYFPLPQDHRIMSHSPYESMSRAEIEALFRAEYQRVKPTSAVDFTKRYNNGNCPNWATVCRRLGYPVQWTVLREKLSLPVYSSEKSEMKSRLVTESRSEIQTRISENRKRKAGYHGNGGGDPDPHKSK